MFCFSVLCNADIPWGPEVARWKTHPSFWPRSWTDICTCLVLTMWVATLISVEQSTRLIWELGREGHLVLRLPVLHTTGRDPTQERELCSRMALSYIHVAIFISIACGLAETCYELSGILHPRQVETTGLAADCLCLVRWFSYCFPPTPSSSLFPLVTRWLQRKVIHALEM